MEMIRFLLLTSAIHLPLLVSHTWALDCTAHKDFTGVGRLRRLLSHQTPGGNFLETSEDERPKIGGTGKPSNGRGRPRFDGENYTPRYQDIANLIGQAREKQKQIDAQLENMNQQRRNRDKLQKTDVPQFLLQNHQQNDLYSPSRQSVNVFHPYNQPQNDVNTVDQEQDTPHNVADLSTLSHKSHNTVSLMSQLNQNQQVTQMEGINPYYQHNQHLVSPNQVSLQLQNHQQNDLYSPSRQSVNVFHPYNQPQNDVNTVDQVALLAQMQQLQNQHQQQSQYHQQPHQGINQVPPILQNQQQNELNSPSMHSVNLVDPYNHLQNEENTVDILAPLAQMQQQQNQHQQQSEYEPHNQRQEQDTPQRPSPNSVNVPQQAYPKRYNGKEYTITYAPIATQLAELEKRHAGIQATLERMKQQIKGGNLGKAQITNRPLQGNIGETQVPSHFPVPMRTVPGSYTELQHNVNTMHQQQNQHQLFNQPGVYYNPSTGQVLLHPQVPNSNDQWPQPPLSPTHQQKPDNKEQGPADFQDRFTNTGPGI